MSISDRCRRASGLVVRPRRCRHGHGPRGLGLGPPRPRSWGPWLTGDSLTVLAGTMAVACSVYAAVTPPRRPAPGLAAAGHDDPAEHRRGRPAGLVPGATAGLPRALRGRHALPAGAAAPGRRAGALPDDPRACAAPGDRCCSTGWSSAPRCCCSAPMLGLSEVSRVPAGSEAFVYLVYPVTDAVMIALVVVLLLRSVGQGAHRRRPGRRWPSRPSTSPTTAYAAERVPWRGASDVYPARVRRRRAPARGRRPRRGHDRHGHAGPAARPVGPVAPILPDLAAFAALGRRGPRGRRRRPARPGRGRPVADRRCASSRAPRRTCGCATTSSAGSPSAREEIRLITEEHRRLDAMKQEFVSAVSHELRTPLTAIRGALEMLADGDAGDLPDAGPARGGDGHAGAASGSPAWSTTSSTSSGSRAAPSASIPPRTTCTRCSWTRPSRWPRWPGGPRRGEVAARRGPGALRRRPGGPGAGQPDRQRLEVHRARRRGHRRGRGDGEGVQVSVHDTGRGIPQDELGAIFARFHQVEPDDARQNAGTGLGLAITQRIVEEHGGSIWVESTSGRARPSTSPCPGPAPAPSEHGPARWRATAGQSADRVAQDVTV